MSELHYEDFTPGRRFPLGPVTVTAAEIVEFAEQFDPAPFHLDAAAGRASMLGGLSASGWHLCAIAMRLMCDSFMLRAAGQGSPGIDKCEWLAPVLAGDVLSGTSRVTSARPSTSRPTLGIIELETILEKADGTKALRFSNPVMFRRREAA